MGDMVPTNIFSLPVISKIEGLGFIYRVHDVMIAVLLVNPIRFHLCSLLLNTHLIPNYNCDHLDMIHSCSFKDNVINFLHTYYLSSIWFLLVDVVVVHI